MNKSSQTPREHDRYDTDVKVEFYVPYNLETQVDFQIEDDKGFVSSSKRYQGATRNISAGGLCFRSNVKLEDGIILYIELALPSESSVIPMEGVVRWCDQSDDNNDGFDIGVQLTRVRGKNVEESIYFDEKYHVIWSEVLETVLGNFAKLHKKVL